MASTQEITAMLRTEGGSAASPVAVQVVTRSHRLVPRLAGRGAGSASSLQSPAQKGPSDAMDLDPQQQSGHDTSLTTSPRPAPGSKRLREEEQQQDRFFNERARDMMNMQPGPTLGAKRLQPGLVPSDTQSSQYTSAPTADGGRQETETTTHTRYTPSFGG